MKPLLYEQELLSEFNRRIRHAKEFYMAQALISESGLTAVQDALCASLAAGGHGKVLVGVDMPTEPAAIEMLLSIQAAHRSQVELRFFKSSERRMLHAKFAVFKDARGQGTAILGSSNLTRGGLEHNYEANILVSDTKVVGHLRDYFDEHFSGGHSRKITLEWLQRYQAIWAERRKVMDRLRGVRSKVRKLAARPDADQPSPKRIKGHAFAFTGKIQDWPREAKLYPRVRWLGGTVVPSAHEMGRAQCLVHGEILGGRKSTRKLVRARQLNVPILSEEEFFRIMDKERRLRAR